MYTVPKWEVYCTKLNQNGSEKKSENLRKWQNIRITFRKSEIAGTDYLQSDYPLSGFWKLFDIESRKICPGHGRSFLEVTGRSRPKVDGPKLEWTAPSYSGRSRDNVDHGPWNLIVKVGVHVWRWIRLHSIRQKSGLSFIKVVGSHFDRPILTVYFPQFQGHLISPES